MHLKKIIILSICLLLISSFAIGQSTAEMYKEATRIFKSYRYDVDYTDFQIKTYEEDGHSILQLLVIIKSGRNSFDRALLVGFAASGAAIIKTGADIDRVSVVVKVQYKEEVSIAATADVGDVLKLFKDEMDASTFEGRLTWH